MSMTTTTFSVSGEVELTYDISSKSFQEALKGYRQSIDRTGTVSGMLQHVAFYVTRFGIDGMVEGVGYVGYNGKMPNKEPSSGIIVGGGYDDFEFDIN